MDKTIQVLRIDMDGRWLADELGSAVSALSELYDLRLVLELGHEDQVIWERHAEILGYRPLPGPFGRRFVPRLIFEGIFPPLLSPRTVSQMSILREYLDPAERLEIRRLNYSSPGVSDLAGIGAIIGHIKDFVVKLIDRSDSRRQRELTDERAAAEIDRVRLENARSLVALGKDLGFTDIEMRRLVAQVDEKQETLVRLIDQKKLIGASIIAGGEQIPPDET